MNNKKNIVLGIIGCGGDIGRFHTENVFFNFPHVRLKTVCDLEINKIKKWINNLGNIHIALDYKEILNDPEINTVFICTQCTIFKFYTNDSSIIISCIPNILFYKYSCL